MKFVKRNVNSILTYIRDVYTWCVCGNGIIAFNKKKDLIGQNVVAILKRKVGKKTHPLKLSYSYYLS